MIREALKKQALQALINCLLAKKKKGEEYMASGLSIDLVLGIMKKMEQEDENFFDEENEFVPLVKEIVEEYIEKRRS